MTTRLLSLVTCVALAVGEPEPGRVPKVYNALITSNQNLEPSKAFPLYQPVLHDPYGFPFQSVYYGDIPYSNGLIPPGFAAKLPPGFAAKLPPGLSPSTAAPPPEASVPDSPPEESATTEDPPSTPADEEPSAAATPASASPPPPPSTESPIPLNQFGLPPQVLPLGRLDPAYNGFTHLGPIGYPYPNLRYYDPYDPFSYGPYANLPPMYRFGNVLGQQIAAPISKEVPAAGPEGSNSTPPPEPADLNLLNYAAKDPAIPNVPPPPLPEGGLKTDGD